MFVTEGYQDNNKMQLLVDIVRADEALATLIEHEYDDEEQISITMKELEYLGVKCELGYNECEEYTIFDEFSNITEGLMNEIKNGDFEIHFNKKYGWTWE